MNVRQKYLEKAKLALGNYGRQSSKAKEKADVILNKLKNIDTLEEKKVEELRKEMLDWHNKEMRTWIEKLRVDTSKEGFEFPVALKNLDEVGLEKQIRSNIRAWIQTVKKETVPETGPYNALATIKVYVPEIEVAHSVLLALAVTKPLNPDQVDPITLDKIETIKEDSLLVTSDGYVFDIEALADSIRSRGKMLNPINNTTFYPIDQVAIINLAKKFPKGAKEKDRFDLTKLDPEKFKVEAGPGLTVADDAKLAAELERNQRSDVKSSHQPRLFQQPQSQSEQEQIALAMSRSLAEAGGEHKSKGSVVGESKLFAAAQAYIDLDLISRSDVSKLRPDQEKDLPKLMRAAAYIRKELLTSLEVLNLTPDQEKKLPKLLTVEPYIKEGLMTGLDALTLTGDELTNLTLPENFDMNDKEMLKAELIERYDILSGMRASSQHRP